MAMHPSSPGRCGELETGETHPYVIYLSCVKINNIMKSQTVDIGSGGSRGRG